MGDVISFPGDQPKLTLVPPKTIVMKFIIGDNEYVVDSVTRPILCTEEWHVHSLVGPTYVNGHQYWAPLTVTGPEEFADAIQTEYPLRIMSLEMLDADGVIQEWWEFEDVYLSTETDAEMFIIYFREALSGISKVAPDAML